MCIFDITLGISQLVEAIIYALFIKSVLSTLENTEENLVFQKCSSIVYIILVDDRLLVLLIETDKYTS